MAKPNLKQTEPIVANGRKVIVRGRPIHEVSRAVLEAEYEAMCRRIDNLHDTLRLQSRMWHEAIVTGTLPENSLMDLSRRLDS